MVNSTRVSIPDFEDRVLVCCDCGQDFVFEKGEQKYFWSKGLMEPKRCPECRAIRRATLVRAPEMEGRRW